LSRKLSTETTEFLPTDGILVIFVGSFTLEIDDLVVSMFDGWSVTFESTTDDPFPSSTEIFDDPTSIFFDF
jgi:hypothetical protein